MESALKSTVDYVTQRKQFGQPIGAFQGVQHRLAEAAVLVEATRWLTFKAGDSGEPADAALAAGYAQEAARRVAYDFHQFHGAMGLTLEHPLHLWTYRLRALLGELGGAAARFEAAAAAVWGDPVNNGA
jgi:alkylation response protein AidB-like acyl-CoA dehydrogenase